MVSGGPVAAQRAPQRGACAGQLRKGGIRWEK